jgi:hypothetical protein
MNIELRKSNTSLTWVCIWFPALEHTKEYWSDDDAFMSSVGWIEVKWR